MSRLSRNIVYNLLGQTTVAILGLAAVKCIFTRLDEDALGIIYFTLTVNAVLCAVLEMGICSTTVREVSGFRETKPRYIHDLIRTASLLYWTAYLVCALAVLLLAPVVAQKWIVLKTLDVETATTVLRILGAFSLLTLPQRFYASLLQGLQRMELTNSIDVAAFGAQQLGTILILSLGGSLVQVACWFAGCFGLTTLAYLLIVARFFSRRSLIPGYSAAVIRRNRRYSANMVSVSVLSIIHAQSDKIILSKLIPIGQLGFYTFAYGLLSRVSVVTQAVSGAVFPSLSALFRAKDRVGMIRQYRKVQDLVALASVPLFALMPFAAYPLFTFLWNAEAAEMLSWPVTLLSVGFCMHATLVVPHAFSLAVGRPQIARRANLAALWIVLPVTGTLTCLFGLTGAALGWVLYHCFLSAYVVPKICSECLRIPSRQWYAHTAKLFLLASFTYGPAWLVLTALKRPSVLSLPPAYLAASVVFVLAAYKWLLGDDFRATLRRLLFPRLLEVPK